MCFSMQADLVVGAASTAMGISAWRDARDDGDRWLAALPVLFGTHLLVEAVVWRGVQGHLSSSTSEFAVRLYLLVALTVVPVVVPLVLRAVDRSDRSRRYAPFVVLGVVVGVVLGVPVVAGAVSAADGGLHVAYQVDVAWGGALTVAYVVATCGPALVASDPRIRTFGVANLVAVTILAVISAEGLISLWCAWAAVTSAAIATRAHRRARLSLGGVGAG